MDQHTFYSHVSKWIRSFENPEALARLTKFITGSPQPDEIKMKLLGEAEARIKALNCPPMFVDILGEQYLKNHAGHPKVFTTRFSAVTEMATLKLKGLDVDLVTTGTFYRIKLNTAKPVQTS